MIKEETVLDVDDNSGAKKVKCFRILKGSSGASGNIGDIIVVSIVSTIPRDSKVQKGQVSYALILKTKYGIVRKDGTKIKFKKNSVALLDKQLNPIGTQIKGTIPREIKSRGYSSISSKAEEVI